MHHLTTSRFIEAVEKETDAATLIARFTKFTQDLGFIAYVLTGLPPIGSDVEPLIIAVNWPDGWIARYREKQFFLKDPVARWSLSRQRAFRWSEAIAANPGYETTEIVQEAAVFGFVDGIAIPLKSERMWKVVVSLAAGQKLDLTTAEIAQVETAVAYFNQCHEDLIMKAAARPALTKREIEILRLCAAGKSAWEIGQIVGISEGTAALHRKSAIKKLGCSNTTQAVVVAIETGLLQI